MSGADPIEGRPSFKSLLDEDLTDSDDEFRVARRQMLGVFSQLEKTRLVKKLRSGRERAKKLGKPAGGQQPHTKLRPKVVAEAKRLRSIEDAKGRRMSLRKISAALAAAGHVNDADQPFNAKSVRAMLRK